MTEFVTTSAGDRVAYDLRGSGPAVIFVAGAGPFRAVDPWTTETAERAAQQGLTTVVADRLGRGESPAGGWIDLDREIAALDALIAVAGGRAVLCGHSSGCTIALSAATRGLPIDGLMLWEAPFGGQSGGAGPWAAEVLQRIENNDLEGALVHYMKDMPPEWLEGARSSPMWDAMTAAVVSYVADAQSLAWSESDALGRLLEHVRVPIEYLSGTATFPMMLTAAETLAHEVPRATHVRVPGADHAWQPEPMAAEVVRFVTAAQRIMTDDEPPTGP